MSTGAKLCKNGGTKSLTHAINRKMWVKRRELCFITRDSI
jgi:hypothetical protein